MATTIDLLPGYVRLQKQRNRALGLSVASIALVTVGLLLVLQHQKAVLETAEVNRTNFERVASDAATAKAEVTKYQNDRAAIDGTVHWLMTATKTGPERAALFNLLGQYIAENAVVTSIDVSDGQSVKLGGTVKDPDEYARFLLNLRRGSDQNGGPLFAGLPTASGPGGFANSKNPAVPFSPPSPNPLGQPVQILYPVKMAALGTLKAPVTIPPDPVAPAVAGAPGGPGGRPGGPADSG